MCGGLGSLLVDRATLVTKAGDRPVLAPDLAGTVAYAGVDPTLEGRALQDALRAAIAHRGGYCWWTPDPHPGTGTGVSRDAQARAIIATTALVGRGTRATAEGVDLLYAIAASIEWAAEDATTTDTSAGARVTGRTRYRCPADGDRPRPVVRGVAAAGTLALGDGAGGR